MSLRNSATCSRVGPVSTLVFVVGRVFDVGRVFAFGVVGVLLPFGLGGVVFGLVVGGFLGCGFFGVRISMLPILICAEALTTNSAAMNASAMSLVMLLTEECVFISNLQCICKSQDCGLVMRAGQFPALIGN